MHSAVTALHIINDKMADEPAAPVHPALTHRGSGLPWTFVRSFSEGSTQEISKISLMIYD